MVNSQSKQLIRQPIAICVSDIHFNIQTISLASAALKQAIDKSNNLKVPLIIAGDIHDQKANIRGECIKVIMDLLQYCVSPPIVIVANHDRINEKSKEHSLEFIRYQARLITEPTYIENIGYILPYYHDPQELRSYLKTLPPKSTIIMHQGLIGSNQGDYIQDKSAITKDDVAGFRVISGHYHQRQTIDLPDGGKWDYIGNPYSLNYGEANDPPKGFQILMDDGSLEFVPTNLRKHIVIDNYISEMVAIPYIHEAGDLVWFKLRGTKQEIASVTKQLVADNYGIEDGFRLDLIPIDSTTQAPANKKELNQGELVDALIDSDTNTSDETKTRLKDLWKGLI